MRVLRLSAAAGKNQPQTSFTFCQTLRCGFTSRRDTASSSRKAEDVRRRKKVGQNHACICTATLTPRHLFACFIFPEIFESTVYYAKLSRGLCHRGDIYLYSVLGGFRTYAAFFVGRIGPRNLISKLEIIAVGFFFLVDFDFAPIETLPAGTCHQFLGG